MIYIYFLNNWFLKYIVFLREFKNIIFEGFWCFVLDDKLFKRKKILLINVVLFLCKIVKVNYILGNCFWFYKNNNLFNILF